MPSRNAPVPCVPQVGALLVLNAQLPEPDPLLGSRDWVLVGSCVLVAPGHILTVEHVQPPRDRRSAAFFPYEGIHELDMATAVGAGYTSGDDLVVAPLASAPSLAPIPVRRISGDRKAGGWAYVGGYGLWEGLVAGGAPGLQRVVRVSTARPPQAPRCDTLDIEWYPEVNRGVRALTYNSGGPVMWGDGRGRYWVVGISREAPPGRQIGSWIGRDRYDWLTGILPPAGPAPATGRTADVDLTVGGAGELVELAVPQGATRASLTLSADGTAPLQVALESPYGGSAQPLLRAAATTPENAGRFLARRAAVAPGTLGVAVAPLDGLPFPGGGVAAQLRVAFHP